MAYQTLDAVLKAAHALPEAEWCGVCIAEAVDGAGFGLSMDLFGVGCELGSDDTVFAGGWHHPARIVLYVAPRSLAQQA